MIQTSPQHRTHDAGEIVVLPRVSDVAGDALPPDLVSGALGRGDLANVVPFRRPKTAQSDAPPCVVDPATRPIPPAPVSRGRRFSLAVAATVLMHGAAFAAFFYYEPKPLASIGIEAISVEIAIGSNTLAGDTDPNSKSTFNSNSVPPEEKVADKPTPDQSQKAPEKPMELAAVEPAPQAAEPPQEQLQEAKPETHDAVARAPNTPLATSEPSEIRPVEIKPVETKPADIKPAEIKRDTPKPVAKKPEPKQDAATRKKTDDTQKKTQIAAAPPAADPSIASKGAGIGRSDAIQSYIGQIRAHLMRYQQYPSEARSRDERGTASVSFSLDGSGRVTWVHLAGNSGHSSLDQETQAMVRRASPFPAPPSGRPQSFTMPIAFYLR